MTLTLQTFIWHGQLVCFVFTLRHNYSSGVLLSVWFCNFFFLVRVEGTDEGRFLFVCYSHFEKENDPSVA